MNKISIKLKCIWKVLVADDFMVITTKERKDGGKIDYYRGYSIPSDSNVLSGAIFAAFKARLKEIDLFINGNNKESDESESESDR